MTPQSLLPSISHDGAYMLTCDDQLSGVSTVHVYNATSAAYDPVGKLDVPAGSGGHGWLLAGSSFSTDAAANKTYVGIVWIYYDLSGVSAAAVYDVSALAGAKAPAAKPVSSIVTTSLNNNMAVGDAAISCVDSLCAAAFWVQKTNGTEQPSVSLLSPKQGASAFFNFSAPGTMDSITAVSAGNGNYYVGASGCSTLGVCITTGGDSYLWSVTGV